MGIKTVKRHKKGGGAYVPAIAGGLKTTFTHFFQNLKNGKNIKTMLYPEEQPADITPRYRGLHRLTKRDDGTIRCTACFLCATNCPANCIFIEATKREDLVDEKMPKKFSIDLLECVFCGYCVEACPCDAIRMDTGIFSVVGDKRDDFLIGKRELLSNERCKDFIDEQ